MLDELIATNGVTEVARVDGPVAVMALHGGLEHATFEMAEAIASVSGASLYSVVQPDDFFWHVPSTRFDPRLSPALSTIVDHAQLALSLHGFGRIGLEDAVLVGGSNRDVANRLATAIRDEGFRAIDELDDIPSGLRGLHPANPVNLPSMGGVQLELSAAVRRSPLRDRLVASVGAFVANLGPRSGGAPTNG